MNALKEISEFDLISSLKKDLSEKSAKLLVAYVKEQAKKATNSLATDINLSNLETSIVDRIGSSEKAVIDKVNSMFYKVVGLILAQLAVVISIIVLLR